MRLVSGKEGKKTKKMITAALGQTPHGAEAHKSLAYYHIFRGNWGPGVEVLAKFTAERPNHPYGWYYYGRCLFDTGKYKNAGEMMQKAYLMYPDDCEIYRGLCDILPAAKRLEELRPIVEEMLRLFPERWSVSATVGRVLVEHFKEFERGCSVSQERI